MAHITDKQHYHLSYEVISCCIAVVMTRIPNVVITLNISVGYLRFGFLDVGYRIRWLFCPYTLEQLNDWMYTTQRTSLPPLTSSRLISFVTISFAHHHFFHSAWRGRHSPVEDVRCWSVHQPDKTSRDWHTGTCQEGQRTYRYEYTLLSWLWYCTT